MDAVGAVDIGVSGRPEHHRIALGRPAKAVRRRIGVVIGLDLDDHAADALEQERRAHELGRDLVHAAGEEVAADRRNLGIEGGTIAGRVSRPVTMPAHLV